MRLFNSISREIEDFESLKKSKVGMYTCGMTVYDFAHIGHGRKYVYDDILRRVLLYAGYEVDMVQNVTDVGHLVSDGDEGEDKMEKGAVKLKKTVWEVAKFYEEDFYMQMDSLNIMRPNVICRATEHVPEQIELVKRLLEKGYAYDTPEAVYFSVSKFPRYEGLFGHHIESKQTGRDEVNKGSYKKSEEDFALWFKRIGRFADHVMHWQSPWGDGFPGWHIECSAMAMKYLGESFDIHTGGLEHQMVHHPNEIAQSEAATGKMFAKYWVHYAHLMVDGVKMSKSIGNVLKVADVVEKGFSAMALRYLYLTAHYRTPLNFTWSSLAAAQSAYDKLRMFIKETKKKDDDERKTLSQEKEKKLIEFQQRFDAAIFDDLGLAGAVAVMWEMVKSNIPDRDKVEQILEWDSVLGLRLNEIEAEEVIPDQVVKLGNIRQQLRNEGKFVEADNARMEIERLGYLVEDSKTGPKFKKKGMI